MFRYTTFLLSTQIIPSSVSFAFVPSTIGTHRTFSSPRTEDAFFNRRTRRQSRLNGINEWRDTDFNLPDKQYNSMVGTDGGIPKKVCVLPFPYDDIILQGETKQLRLYESRFIKLFDTCMNEHGGILAMGLIAESGIIQTAPLCEVEAYSRMGGEFGIFVTIRVVGRASLLELKRQEPYIEAVCLEVRDETPKNLELPDMVAGNIEKFMETLSRLEQRLDDTVEMTYDDDDELNIDDIEDEEMKTWILDGTAKGIEIEFDDDDEDDSSNFEENNDYEDRMSQYKEAFLQAKNSDSQGYMISSDRKESERDIQDLAAISWAAFCTNDVDDKYRIQALDINSLFDRLKLGSYMLREKKAELEAKLALSEINTSNDEDVLQ